MINVVGTVINNDNNSPQEIQSRGKKASDMSSVWEELKHRT